MNRIALVMIARDEARCIERCLLSARDAVDEMVVLDTGSSDDTVARAESAGARVHRGRWRDDFAAARNASLQLTDADWALVLDADEWIAGGLPALQALRTAPAQFVGVITVTNLFGPVLDGASESPSWIPRILPRGARYTGRFHEQPQSPWPRRRIALEIRHDGYLEPVQRAKRERNKRLLARALAEQPDDAYLVYQAGKDFELRGEFVAALSCYQRALAGADGAAAWRHDLVLRSLFTLKKNQRHQEAFALAQAESARFAESPDLHFALGDVLLDWAATEPARAMSLVPLIESNWQRALELGERPDLPDSVRGRGSWLAAHNLAVLHEGLGRAEQAEAWRGRAAQMRAAAESPA